MRKAFNFVSFLKISMNVKMDLSVVYQMHIVSTLLVAIPAPVSQDILEMERPAIVICSNTQINIKLKDYNLF